MKIEKIVLFANKNKLKIKLAIDDVLLFFKEKNISVDVIELTGSSEDCSINVKDYDLAVSLGGDGTVLSCASIMKELNIPIFAVNLGTFGYLAEISLSEYKDVFNELEHEKTHIIQRMRLEACVIRKGSVVYKNSVLNEFTVSPDIRARMGKINLSINGISAADFKADGIIIATPSGSTAYNLSAGGPILDADMQSVIINAICPFSMGMRPLVISDKSYCMVEIPKQNVSFILTCDGHEVFQLKEDDVVKISKSPKYTYFVKNPRRNFIEVLRDKLGWAGGFNA